MKIIKIIKIINTKNSGRARKSSRVWMGRRDCDRRSQSLPARQQRFAFRSTRNYGTFPDTSIWQRSIRSKSSLEQV